MGNKSFIIKTFQNNEVPAQFNDVKIYIKGQDIVIKTQSGDTYEYPFAAQFLTMSNDAFNLVFTDGKTISSNEILNYIDKNNFDIDGSLNHNKIYSKEKDEQSKDINEVQSDNEQENSDGKETVEDVIPDIQVVEVTKIEEVVVEKISASKEEDASESKLNPVSSEFTNVAEFEIDGEPEKPQVIASSSANQKDTTTVVYVIDNYLSSDKFKVSTYQKGTDIDDAEKSIRIGGSRTDDSYDAQYGRITYDGRDDSGNWKVDTQLNGWDYQEGKILRIVSVNNIDSFSSIKFRSAMDSDFKLILAGTPEGEQLGLKSNQFALIYPSKDSTFSIEIGFESSSTELSESNKGILNFVTTSSPDVITNTNGSINLGYTPNDITLKLGRGDDLVYASKSNDIYDGGEGNNTLDYSGLENSIIFDQSQPDDISHKLKQYGIQANDSGKVTVSNGNSQYVNNFETILGTNNGDKFILNDKGHSIKGGKDDDTFSLQGGSNSLDGGDGFNTLDYSRTGGDDYNAISVLGNDTDLVINGVTVDFTIKKTTNNGYDKGQDTFSNIQKIIGSKKNDHIILGDDDLNIIENEGNNYIEAGQGNYNIDGGKNNTILDYIGINDFISVDLNKGQVTKGNNTDTLNNITHVIGSTGGTAFIGKESAKNILVGVDGDNSFKVIHGNNTLYGGLETNTYNLDTGVSTIWAKGKENTTVVKDSILTYNGSSGDEGQNSDYENKLTYDGGDIKYFSGDGYSTNKITSINSGTITFYAKGNSSFNAKNGGNNTVYLEQGYLVYGSENGGNNTIKTETETKLTLLGGKASHLINLADNSEVELNYAKYSKDKARHTLNIDLSNKRIINIDDNDYSDQLVGGGLVNKIQGLDEGNTLIALSQNLQEDMDIDLFGQNNSVLVGKGFVNIIVNNADETNKVDYSEISEQRLSFDLSKSKGNLYRFDTQGQLLHEDGESLTNVNYIIGNNANGNIYKATEQFGVTFETGQGTGNTIIETKGDHTYKLQGIKITYDASALDQGIIFNYVDNSKAMVYKDTSESTSTLIGMSNNENTPNINKIIGSSHDDKFIFNLDQRSSSIDDIISLITGGGKNNIFVNNYGIIDINNSAKVLSKPNEEYNTLEISYKANSSVDIMNFDGESGQKGTVKTGNISDIYNSEISEYLTNSVLNFNYIDKIIYKGNNDFRANWGTSQSVNLSVYNGNNDVSLFVNGGGNIIDLGYTDSLDKTAFISYVNTQNSGIIYDAINGNNIVSFSDERSNDELKNFNVIQGTDNNDSITLNNGLTFLSSGGDDTLIGNEAVYQLNKTHTQVNADFAENKITKYKDDNINGVDTLSGVGFSKFINSTASTKATIYSSLDKNMVFELKQGYVNFYSNVKMSNTIQTDNANLTLHYEQFKNKITVNNNTVTKEGEKTDTFTTAAVLNGSNYGDTYKFTGTMNNNKALIINAGKGIDTFDIKNIASSITINAVENNETSKPEIFTISGNLKDSLNINSENSNNQFNLKSVYYKGNIIVNSKGGNDFSLNQVNINNKSAYALNINLTSSDYVDENHFSFSKRITRTFINLQGGKNVFDFNDADTTDVTISTDNSARSEFSAKDSSLNIYFNSKNGSDTFDLNNITNYQTERSVFDTIYGNNSTQGKGNHFNISKQSVNLTINAGVRDDKYTFDNVDASNLSITDNGGNNTFDLSGTFTSSIIKSGSGNDSFSFNAIKSGSSTGLDINVEGGENTFNFAGDNTNSKLVINDGNGNSIFNFNTGSINHLKDSKGNILDDGIKITASGGNNLYNFVDENSLPAQINGGKGIDRLTFNGVEISDFNVFKYTLNQTKSLEQLDFTSLLKDKGTITLNFDIFKSVYENSNDDNHLDIYLGSKETVNISSNNAIGWAHKDNPDGTITYYNEGLGIGDVILHYNEQPPALV